MEPKPLDWLPPDGRDWLPPNGEAARLKTMLAGFPVGAVAAVLTWMLMWFLLEFEGFHFPGPASVGEVSFVALIGGGLGGLAGYVLRLDAQRRGESRLWTLRKTLIASAGAMGLILGAGVGGPVGGALCQSCELEIFAWIATGLVVGAATGAALGVVVARLALRSGSRRAQRLLGAALVLFALGLAVRRLLVSMGP